jgi:hypothetical protein
MESLEATEREVALHGTLAALTKCVRPCTRTVTSRVCCMHSSCGCCDLKHLHGMPTRMVNQSQEAHRRQAQQCLQLVYQLCRTTTVT